MSARHSHRWLAWLLPMFMLRAFVPAGFMLSWSDAGLQLVICSGSGPMTKLGQVPASDSFTESVTEAGQHQQHGAVHADGAQHHHSQADSATLCPFAAAGTSGALPSFEATVAFFATLANEVRAPANLQLPVAPVLIDRIRGPPLA